MLKFFSESFSVSLLIFGLLYILKGDSDNSIKKSRERLYKKIKERVDLVFKYRYDFPTDDYNEEIKDLTQYTKIYKKEKVLFSIWHSGTFIATVGLNTSMRLLKWKEKK